MADWLTYSNHGATRSMPISDELVQAMSFLPELGITMDVYSGGQPSSGPNRVGSTRHDHGNAADVTFHREGRMLDWNNPADIPTLSDIVSRARSAGVTGIGAGNDYMGPGRVHIGFGNPSVWGAGGRSANAPEWLRSAYYGAPSPSPAVNAINRATGMPTPPLMRASTQPPEQGGFWSNPLGFVRQTVGNVGAPIMRSASNPRVQQQAVGNLMGTVSGRTAIMRALMAGNTAPRPSPDQLPAFRTAFEYTSASGFGSDASSPYQRSTSISG